MTAFVSNTAVNYKFIVQMHEKAVSNYRHFFLNCRDPEVVQTYVEFLWCSVQHGKTTLMGHNSTSVTTTVSVNVQLYLLLEKNWPKKPKLLPLNLCLKIQFGGSQADRHLKNYFLPEARKSSA